MFIDYMVTGSVENGLISDLKKKKCLVFVLIDSEIANVNTSVRLAKDSEAAGASAILVGGSTATDQMGIAETVKKLKKAVKIPIILFPGNVTGVVSDADAILFSSLLNSENPYYISQAQALLLSLGVIKASDMNVIIDLSKQIDILKDSDIFPEKEDEVIRVIELIVKQACNS